MMANVLITGCSSGFGLLTAQRFARAGHRVFATVRDPARAADVVAARDAERLPIDILPLDVCDDASVQAAVGTALAAGPIDVLVNNAGYLLTCAVEEAADDEVWRLFDTNVFGIVRLVRVVAPGMRERRSGVIANVSSMAAFTPLPFGGLYGASKAAVSALSEALFQELAPFGVHVVLVEPAGYPTTRFVANKVAGRNSTSTSPYAAHRDVALAARTALAAGESLDPQNVADAIYAAVSQPEPRFRHLVGAPAERAAHLRRSTDFEGYLRATQAMPSSRRPNASSSAVATTAPPV
jgi:NAD(P)-dependent dehydrogenase (short-subunit alcohol dehydrogenase family)